MASPDAQWSQVYTELRRVAAAKLADENAGQTLDATGLVHEAWLKLADASIEWTDRTHFMRTAATAMRHILVDRARAKLAAKRNGGALVQLADVPAPLPDAKLVALDEALIRLAAFKPAHAKLVELRFFGGLNGEEAAIALNISAATAGRMWRYTRAWLQVAMEGRRR
jgi:RNA polymerase sigma factor (TIGR02999 family)